MLRHRVIPSTCTWRSIRCASQQSPAAASSSAQNVQKTSSIISRLSGRTQSSSDGDSEQKLSPKRTHAGASTRHPATSFISARSAQKRDLAAEKWFTDVRMLDINPDQPKTFKSLPPRKRSTLSSPTQHEMRPKTDLSALFTPSADPSTVTSRLQTKKELGGDYASYLPDEHVDPYRLPVAYARLVLGRNKHVPLYAQTGALNVVEEAIWGKAPKQVV